MIYDVVVVGSSPLSLIEATHYALQGKSVAIVERDDSIGGAWKTFELGNITNIDYGCHIINPVGAAYGFLRDAYKLDLIRMEPQPAIIAPLYSKPYSMSSIKGPVYRLISAVSTVFKLLSRLKFKQAAIKTISLKNLIVDFSKNFFEIVNQQEIEYIYPKGGAVELLKKIADKAVNSGVKIISNTNVHTIKIDDGLCTVVADYRSIQSYKLVISSGSSLANLYVDGNKIEQKDLPRSFPHIFLNFKEKSDAKNSFTYLYFQSHEFLDRINEITQYVDDKEHAIKTRKIMVMLSQYVDLNHMDEKKVNEIISLLQKYNFISQDVEILDCKKYDYAVNYRNVELLEYYKKVTNGVVDFIFTQNLAESIDLYADKWANLRNV